MCQLQELDDIICSIIRVRKVVIIFTDYMEFFGLVHVLVPGVGFSFLGIYFTSNLVIFF